MNKMTYQQSVKWVEQKELFLGMQFELSRIREVLRRVGNSQDKLRVIHIAGTNGKGSTTMLVSRILAAAGYRVGLYLSPHVVDIRERIQVNGQYISRTEFAELASLVERNSAGKDRGKERIELTYFEVLTAMALIYFYKQNTDFAVLETGLGGRLDATNVVKHPLVCVITNIGLEHTDYLGNTLSAIAGEKAGIIKPGSSVVTSATQPVVLDVFRKVCRLKKSELYRLGKEFKVFSYSPSSLSSPRRGKGFGMENSGQRLNYQGVVNSYKNINLNLPGEFQLNNAGLALAAVELLSKSNIFISEKTGVL